jgi:hypothetical protein
VKKSSVLDELEEDLSTLEYTNRATQLHRAIRELDETRNPELVQQLTWEAQVFALRVPCPAFPREEEQWFLPLMQWTGGPPYPDVAGLMEDDRALAYYRQRADETTNPIHRARYCDFLWEALHKRKDKDAHQYARRAIQAYLDCVPIYLQQRGYLKLADALPRAVELAMSIGDENVAQKVIQTIVSTLDQLPGDERARWILDLGRALLALRKSRLGAIIGDDDLKTLLRYSTNGQNFFQQKGNFHLQRECLWLAADISQALGDPTGALQWRIRVAESFEEEARTKAGIPGPEGGNLVASYFYEQAVHTYLRILSMSPHEEARQEIRRRIETLKRGIRQALKKAEEEMKPIVVKLELPVAELEPIVQKLVTLDAPDAFRALAAAEWLLPDIERMREHAEEVTQTYVFSQLFPTRVIYEGTKVREYGIDEKVAEQMNTEMGIFIRVQMVTLDYVFSRLREAGLLTQDTLVDYLARWELMDESDLELIEAGLERYFAEDHVSAIHILAPRVEKVLKGMFEKAGLVPLKDPERGTLMEEELGKFLRKHPEVKDSLGERTWHYLEYVLINPAGLNLRNDVAHGWISKVRCNRYMSQILIYLFILLTRFAITPTLEEAGTDAAKDGGTT